MRLSCRIVAEFEQSKQGFLKRKSFCVARPEELLDSGNLHLRREFSRADRSNVAQRSGNGVMIGFLAQDSIQQIRFSRLPCASKNRSVSFSVACIEPPTRRGDNIEWPFH
jgi:hypothetical protein